jgi:hypothetical protein
MDLDKDNFLEKLTDKVKSAFKALDYSDYNSESEAFMLIWDGAMAYVLLKDPENSFIIYEALLNKYNL